MISFLQQCYMFEHVPLHAVVTHIGAFILAHKLGKKAAAGH